MIYETNVATSRCQVRLLENTALRANQRGAALAISLVFLLLLTIIGITATSSSRLEEKMSGNLRDLSASAMMSESGLRAARDWVSQQAVGGTPLPENTAPGAGEVWTLGSANAGNLADASRTWWMTNGLEYGVTGTDEFVSTDTSVYFQADEDPRYVVEGYGSVVGVAEFATQNSQAYYRITAFGTGLTGNAQTVTQGSVFTRFN